MRDYDLLVPASAEALVIERHAADRAHALRPREAEAIAEFGVKPPRRAEPGLRHAVPRRGDREPEPDREGASPADDRRAGPGRWRGRRRDRGPGLVVSCSGSGRTDDEATTDALARRVTELRIFDDADGRTNLSLVDVGGAVLVVSQFTLYADTRRGRRPGFTGAAAPGARRAPATSGSRRALAGARGGGRDAAGSGR